MIGRTGLCCILALGAVGIAAPAQTPPNAAEPAPSSAGTAVIPAETIVLIEIVEPVGSRHSRTGQQFAIRLAEPILVEGRVVVPAGVTGVGEVVHAAHAGTKAGELIVAARYLQFGETRIPLHRTRYARSGRDISGITTGPNYVGMWTSGSNIELRAGSKLPVYVAAPVAIPMPAP